MTTDYTHPAYDAYAPLWEKVRDAVAGEDAVKAASIAYLPKPNKLDTSVSANQRYLDYLQRAVYYNATGRTLAGLVGVAFANWPDVKLPSPRYEYLLTDADGTGVGLIGQSQWMLSEVLQTGRGGLLVDTSGDPDNNTRRRSIAEADAAGLRVFVTAYSAESILTWETDASGRLSRLVLKELHTDYESGEVIQLDQLRELEVVNGVYSIKVWRKFPDGGGFVLADTITPSRPDGEEVDAIPFVFVGAVNNDTAPDQPPLLDLANLNLAHYRDSADYQESVFLLGQPMFWVSGVDTEWKARMEQEGMYVGARALLPLPEGGSCGILQAKPNTLAKEAMADKERMMATLGARLAAPGEAAKTATQSAAETKASYSVLSLACDNVSEAYTRAIALAYWMRDRGIPSESAPASFAIDTRFNDLTLDANAIRETVAAWQAGLVPQSDAWTVLRRLGVVDQGKTDEVLRDELAGQGPSLDLDAAA